MQDCVAIVWPMEESGVDLRSCPTVRLEAPNTPLSQTSKNATTGVKERPALAQVHLTDLFANTASTSPAVEGGGASSANPTVELPAVLPSDGETVVPRLSILGDRVERAAIPQAQGDLVHEVAKKSEQRGAPEQAPPAVATAPEVANPTGRDRTAAAKLKVPEAPPASPGPPSDPASSATVKAEKAPLLDQEVDAPAPGPAHVTALNGTRDLGFKMIQAEGVTTLAPPIRPQNLKPHATGADFTQTPASRATNVPKQSVTTRTQDTGTSEETDGGATAAALRLQPRS